ncbi:MAG TPA: hypothetical protein PLE30_03925 [Candidatus Kapabacteria bacterium]|nr:hypothetical protein [Candidatus Kapabacteria bacterium]
MKKIVILFFFFSSFLICLNDQRSYDEFLNLHDSLQISSFYCLTSEIVSVHFDSIGFVPFNNNIIDLRRSKRFNNLKYHFLNSMKDSSYYILINRVGLTLTNKQGEENNTNIKEFAQYLFIKDFDSKKSGSITVFYYNKNDTICSTIFDSNIVFEKLRNRERLNLKLNNKIKPEFMFDFLLFKVDGKKEKSIIFEPNFWRFPSDCGYLDFDKVFYENDAIRLFSWLRLLYKKGILFDKFGHTDQDFL